MWQTSREAALSRDKVPYFLFGYWKAWLQISITVSLVIAMRLNWFTFTSSDSDASRSPRVSRDVSHSPLRFTCGYVSNESKIRVTPDVCSPRAVGQAPLPPRPYKPRYLTIKLMERFNYESFTLNLWDGSRAPLYLLFAHALGARAGRGVQGGGVDNTRSLYLRLAPKRFGLL